MRAYEFIVLEISDRIRKQVIDKHQDLQEVAMNPGTYRRFLDSKDSVGIKAGFEAELVFRDVQYNPNSKDIEDWTANEPAVNIDGVIDFFSGNLGWSLTNTEKRELREKMRNGYMIWVGKRFHDHVWTEENYLEWVRENKWARKKPELLDRAAQELELDVDDDRVVNLAWATFRKQAQQQWKDQGPWYEQADRALWNQHRDDTDEKGWFDSMGMSTMREVMTRYNLRWPYRGSFRVGDSTERGRTWDEIARSLRQATGLPVQVSDTYKGVPRRPGQYVLEPDSSIESDGGESGLEVVSPYWPLPQALEQLKKVIDWARDPNGGNAYSKQGDKTGQGGTGLHMNVSLPSQESNDIDPIKLILFMGDKELLERFGRQSNTYTQSAFDRLQTKIRDMRDARPDQINGIMELMKKNIIELARRDLQSGVLGNKYVSVNPHGAYIEFRGPGGDYLAKEDEITGVLENTMIQLAYAMHIAGRPDLYRDEYAKKLYKTLIGFRGAETSKGPRSPRHRTEIETETDDPFMRLFADYSASRINAAGLKQRWAETVLAAEKAADEKKAIRGSAQEYEVFDRDSSTQGDRDSFTVIDSFYAYSDDAAQKIAQYLWSGKGIDFGVRRKVPEPDEPKDRRAEVARRIKQSTEKKAADEFLDKSQQTPGSAQAYRVTWREQRDGETVQDGLRVQAGSAQEAIERLQRTLQDWGRQGWDFAAEPVDRRHLDQDHR
jgi:hypothetical protein